jgi:hypothetical protein
MKEQVAELSGPFEAWTMEPEKLFAGEDVR